MAAPVRGRLLLIAGATAAGAAVTFGLVIGLTWVVLAATGLGMGDAPTPPYLVLNLAASFLAALLGGGVAAALGGTALPARVLALVLLLLSVGSILQPAPGQPGWYPLVVAVLAALGAVVGGATIHRRRVGAGADSDGPGPDDLRVRESAG